MSVVLQTAGQVCPFPLVEAHQSIAGLPAGEELVIKFDCTTAENGHQVTHFDRTGDASWTISIRKS